MIFQFTMGSVEDRQKDRVQVSVQNAGIQAANVYHVFKRLDGHQLIRIDEKAAKVQPQEELLILDEANLHDVDCELVLKSDSPAVIVTIFGETRRPLHCRMYVVDDIEVDPEDESSGSRSVCVLWGYLSKGDPF